MSVAVDLRKAAHAGLEFKLFLFPRLILFHIYRKQRARSDKVHIPFEHVKQLQKLVELKASYKSAHFGEVLIVVFDNGIVYVKRNTRCAHGAEFDHFKKFTAFAHSLLQENGGALAVYGYCD